MARWFDEREAQRRQAEQEAARAHKAAQESLRPASEQKVKTAPLVVNLDKQTNQSAARVASRIPDETERDGFLNEYIAHVKKQNSPNHQKYAPSIGTMRELTDATVTGGVYADTRAKNEKQRLKEIETQKAGKTAMVELAEMPLMGFDGQSINANTADAATVIRGINSIADDTLRARAAKAFKTLTQTEGSRFYGENTDGVGTFLESANLTRDEYRDATEGYASRFYGDGKHDEEDAAAYLEARQEIEESAYSDYAKSQLTAALDKAYTGITGGEAPSASADDAPAEAADEGRATEKEQKKEKKPGFWSGLTGKVPEQDEQTEQPIPVKTAQEPVRQKKAESGAAMQARFGGEENGGNVDLTRRPQVDYQTMEAAGWGDYTEPGSVSTVLTTGYGAPEDGFMAQMTPIREDGTVLTPEELDAYYDNVLDAVKAGKSIAEADPDHLVLASKQGTPEELKGQAEWLDNYGEELHNAQEAYYEPESEGESSEVQGPIQMTPEERIVAQGGMSFAEWMAAGMPGGDGEREEKETAETIGEAADALLKGRYDQIEGAGKDELDRMLAESGNARRMIGTLTEADSQRILVGNDMADAVTYGNIAAQGQTVKTLYDVMKSDSFPDELRGDVMAQMVVWAAQAEAMEQAGTLGGDTELPLMERLLTTDEHAMDELESIYAARDELLADKADMRRAQEEASAQALSDARTAALKGMASEEQLALVRQNAQAGQDELNADMGYVGRLAAVDDYFRPGASKGAVSPFDLSSVKLNLDAQGVIDTGDYQAQLKEQMDALLEEDTQTALALGLTLDEYYAKTGGVDMNALCERAASRISQQGAAITDEEMAALDVPFGQGVGASYTVGAGIRAGGEQWYLDFKDSLYTGYSQGMVLVNAARIQNRYQNEYGAYGRTQYRKDIESALASGTLDENYANALRKALAGAADVYQLGIDPMDFEGDFLKNSAEVRRDIATMEGFMRTNATEDEFKWFGRVKGMTYNAVSAGVAAGTTLATGNSLLGFNTGYSVVGFKNNFDEYLQKGYSIDSSRYLSAVNTGLNCAANFGTFEGVLGRMTGMSALTEAARSRIIRNPAGACRGLAAIRAFGKAFAQNEFDEVVHDEFFEGLSANWTDNALGEVFRRMEAGEDISFTDGLAMILAGTLNPASYDVGGVVKDVGSNAVENAIGAVLFSLSSAAGSGVGTLRGVKAAQDLMNGKRTDVENVILDVTKTLGDEQACALLNDYARQQKESKAVAEEIISGKDERGSAAHAAKAKQQADEARAQAEAAQTAADNSRAQFTEASDAVMNGDLTRQKEMTEARVRMGENQKTANEQGAVAARRTDEMQQAAAQRLAEARQAGRKAVVAEDAAAREAMLDDREARMQAIDNEIAQLDAQQQAAEEEFYAATQSYTEAEAMGMDEETLGQLDARMNEIGARLMALYDRREALQNPEAYEARAHPETEILNLLDRSGELKGKLGGMEASIGKVGADAGQEGVDQGGIKNPVFQKFSSVIGKHFGTQIVVADLGDGLRGHYDPQTNRLYISSRMGTGEAMRVVLCHELTHFIENGKGYGAYRDAVLQAAYHGNETAMRHDVERITEVYAPVYERDGRTFTPEDAQKELVARATETVIGKLADWTKTGGETQIYDLLGEKQRFGVRLYNSLTQFIARVKAKTAGRMDEYNDLVKARDALRTALMDVGKAAKEERRQYALDLEQDSLFDPVNPDTRYSLVLNQFGNVNAQKIDTLTDRIKQGLLGDAHEKQINREQVERANARYDQEGADALIADLASRDMWTADETVAAQVAMLRSQDEGYLVRALRIAQMYDDHRSKAGQALQAGNALKRLTASGAMAEMVRQADDANRKKGVEEGNIPVGDSPPVKKQGRIYDTAETVQQKAQSAPNSDVVSTDNPLHIPLSGAQTALIDHYGLWGTKLPGYDYFKASVKERQLAAIIATPNNNRGNGLLTLCQQLEFMKRGYAVVTEADLNYITGEMATYQLLEGDNETPQTPEGKTIIQRMYSAQANTKQNSAWQKFNNYGYDSMLSGSKTYSKSFESNVLIRPLELTSEAIGSVADRMIAKRTGNRTTALSSKEGRQAGKQAFADEIANTLTDYIIRGVDTGHSSSFDMNHNNRTYNNAFMQACHDFIAMAMQLGDRPFYEQCYQEELDAITRLGTKIQDTRETADGYTETYLRDMTQEERHAEATRRATERVFQEDNAIIDAINRIKRENKGADMVITAIMPFLKTPTNVAIRSMQYSPIGLAYTVVKNGLIDAKMNNGVNFDQRKFVMNLGRGLTGTGMMVLGIALANMGLIRKGREDEDDAKLAAIEKSNGRSYGMYFDLGGIQIPLDFAFPAIAPLVTGAEVAESLDQFEGDFGAMAVDMNKRMAASSIDQLFDNSMLSGVSDVFRGYKDGAQIATSVLEGVVENTASRLTPSAVRAFAKFIDPYVRDTKSQNYIRQVINQTIIQNWPLLRQTLPTAKTITGEEQLQTGANSWNKESQNAALHFLNSFITPWTAGSETSDALLDELVDIAYRKKETGWLPGQLVSGNKYEVSITKTLAKELKVGKVGFNQYEGFKIRLTDEEKRWANSTYADTLFNGSGRDVIGLRTMMSGSRWERMSDEERMEAVRDMQKTAKKQVLTELVRRKKEAGEIR
jgi:hypothetical protein